MDVFKLLRKTLSFKLCWEIMKIEKSEENLSEIGHFKALHSFGEVNESFGQFYFRIAFGRFHAILYFPFSKLYEKGGIGSYYTYAIENFRFFFFTARVLFQGHLQSFFHCTISTLVTIIQTFVLKIFMWDKYHIKLLLNEINNPHELPFDWLMMW